MECFRQKVGEENPFHRKAFFTEQHRSTVAGIISYVNILAVQNFLAIAFSERQRFFYQAFLRAELS